MSRSCGQLVGKAEPKAKTQNPKQAQLWKEGVDEVTVHVWGTAAYRGRQDGKNDLRLTCAIPPTAGWDLRPVTPAIGASPGKNNWTVDGEFTKRGWI